MMTVGPAGHHSPGWLGVALGDGEGQGLRLGSAVAALVVPQILAWDYSCYDVASGVVGLLACRLDCWPADRERVN